MNLERIIVGDDDRVLRQMLEMRLRNARHIIVASVGSVEELEAVLLKSYNVTLGIFDNQMPKTGDGERAAEALRKSFQGVKVISFASDLQTWGDDNVQKPDIKRLLSAVLKI